MRVDFTDLRYNLGAKALLLRTYYDLDEYEAFLSLYDAFRQYIKRNKKVTESQRHGYSNLFRFTKRAFILKNKKDLSKKEIHKEAVIKLKQALAAENMIFNQNWLKEKVEELIG